MGPEIWTTIGVAGPTAVIVAILIMYGWPALKEWLGLLNQRELQIRQWAKEGTADLITQLKNDVAELKGEVQTLRAENKVLINDRRTCEREQAELKATVQLQHNEIAGLKAQNAQQAIKIAELQKDLAKVTAAQEQQAK
jgi:chromosome segregation ATPase